MICKARWPQPMAATPPCWPRASNCAADAGVPLARADALPSATATASETEYVRQSELATSDLPRMLTSPAR
jgi:hypothetical protein